MLEADVIQRGAGRALTGDPRHRLRHIDPRNICADFGRFADELSGSASDIHEAVLARLQAIDERARPPYTSCHSASLASAAAIIGKIGVIPMPPAMKRTRSRLRTTSVKTPNGPSAITRVPG